jgi:hypothetical protein
MFSVRHTVELFVDEHKSGWLIQLFYLISTNVTKLSILLFYRRLTDRVSSRFRIMLYATIFIIAAGCVAGVITHCLSCRPLQAYWLIRDAAWVRSHKYTCFDEAIYVVFMATFSMITDCLVCILPLSMCMRLNMHWRQKVALALIFGAGFL